MLNHRTRLILVMTGFAACILAAVLYGVVGLSKNLELRADKHMLDSALSQLSDNISSTGKVSDIKEVYQAFPNVSFAVYDKANTKITEVGRLPLQPTKPFDLVTTENAHFATEGLSAKNYLIVGGLDWNLTEARLHRFSLILLFLWFFMVFLVGIVSYLAAAATFRPLFSLTEQAANFGGQDLSSRLESGDHAEFGQFTMQLNALLDRVEETARREEQFAADAAHELRTPLAILRGRIESTLLKPRTSGEYQHALNALLPEVDRLTRLVEMLLRSATATHEAAPITELSAVIEDTASRWLDRFAENGVHLEVHAEEVFSQIWPEELQCIVDNFLGNALRVSPKGSECKVILEVVNNRAVVRVADQGAGVPEELIGKVFERFTRGEASRNRTSGGFGIGLAVCKTIVTTRGGSISVQNRKPGAEFKVELQRVSPA
jgi:signal transduction histidine kinase